MAKRQRSRRADEKLRFGHCVETWIRASYFGTRGVKALMHALMAQQTPDWAKQRRRVRKARTAFEEAARWLQISMNVPMERPAPEKDAPEFGAGEANETKSYP